jgi:uncharacterized membrane protein
LPAGFTAAIATSYVAVVAVLSWAILKESFGLVKAIGLVLTLCGVAIMSLRG